jgi:hypothetical protein
MPEIPGFNPDDTVSRNDELSPSAERSPEIIFKPEKLSGLEVLYQSLSQELGSATAVLVEVLRQEGVENRTPLTLKAIEGFQQQVEAVTERLKNEDYHYAQILIIVYKAKLYADVGWYDTSDEYLDDAYLMAQQEDIHDAIDAIVSSLSS